MSTSHYPLEISTDNGGVNALLPSGQLLIDKTSSSSISSPTAHNDMAVAADDSDQIQHKGQRGKVKRDESGISDQIPSLFIDEKRCSETPNTSPMSNNTTRDEGPLSPAEPLINIEVEENSLLEGNSLIGNNSTVVTNQQQQQPRHPQEQGLIEIGSRSRSESPSITQTQTNSSSIISDDITFNSYAPSELSSMMSHMEIQNLLKQGRKQQQHEMMAVGNNRSIPVDIRGRESPMKLFHNQSLYANVGREEEGGGVNSREGGESSNNPCPDGRRITRGVGGGRPPTPPIPQSISSPSRSRSEAGSSVLYPRIVQSNPSSSSHLLHRTDAMEDNGSIRDTQVHYHHQQQRQGYYPQPPQIIQNNSTWTSLPSMSSTVTPGQNNNYEMYSRGDGRLEVRPPPSLGDEEEDGSSRYQEIGHSTPLRSPLSAQNNDQVGLKVDVVEIAVSDDNEDEAVESVLDDSATAISLGTTTQSVLGTSTKSLADDLNYPHDYYEDDNDRKQPQYATVDPRARQTMHSSTSPPPIHHTSVLSGVDDGSYFADRSSYNNVLSSAHDISDYSTSVTNSFSGIDLKKAMPMNVASEDETENSLQLHHQYGYNGHTYDQQPPQDQKQPQMTMVHSKPIIPSTFPSLMDSSVSSGLTEITFPSMAPSVVSVKCSQSEREEREDSLPPHIAQQHRSAQEEDGANVTAAAAAAQHIDPLMTTTTSQPVGMMHHQTQQAGPPQAAMPTAHSSDPRMNIEYERQYIVDLEQIVEESSNHDLRSGGASTASSPIASPRRNKGPGGGAEVSSEAAAEQRRFQSIPEGHNNHQQQQQQPQMLNYQPTEFFDYRHQYYTEQINTEQYHYFDDRYSQASTNHTRGEDETEASSTCSSVTLSQAFHHSDGTDSCASSMTDEYSESHSSHPSLTSTVSSVTLSHALSVDRHDHSGQGFYVATRLGHFVDVPTVPDGVYDVSDDVNVGDEPFSSTTTPDDDVYKTEEVPQHDDLVEKTGEFTIDSTSGSFVRMNSESTNKSGGTDDSTDAVSDITAAAVAKDDVNNKKSDTQVSSSTGNSLESELLATLVPECGVPIPSVMAKVGTARARSSSKGGMLLPWHSTRSIQNYQGRRGSKKLYSSRSREGNLYSISSVHTFRG